MVVSGLNRFACVAMTLLLFVAPAVMEACPAWCDHAARAGAPSTQAHAGHAGHSSDATAAAQSHTHNHTGTSTAPQSGPSAQQPAPPPAPAVQLTTACADCCADQPHGTLALVDVERGRAKALGVSPAAPAAASDLSAMAQWRSAVSLPPFAATPSRPLLALRI